MNPAADIARLVKASTGFNETVVLPSGRRVQVIAGTASSDDTLLNEAHTSGYTKTLTCATVDCDELVPLRDWVLRKGLKYQVTGTTLLGTGHMTKIFLGDVL